MKRMIVFTALAATLALAMPGTAMADFTFVHISDLHVSDNSDLNAGNHDRNGAMFKQLRDSICALAPSFVLVSGDISNAGAWPSDGMYPAITQHLYPAGLTNPLHGAYKMNSAQTIPIYFVPGNHDFRVTNLDPVTSLDVTGANYKKYIGPIQDTFFIKDNAVIICLNSGYDDIRIDATPLQPEGSGLTNAQLGWLGAKLNANNTRKKIIQMHHPGANARGTLWNSAPYSDPMLDIDDGGLKNNSLKFRDTCAKYNVDVVLEGHVEQNVVNDRYGNIVDRNWTGGTRYVQTAPGFKGCYRSIVVGATTVFVDNPKRIDLKATPAAVGSDGYFYLNGAKTIMQAIEEERSTLTNAQVDALIPRLKESKINLLIVYYDPSRNYRQTDYFYQQMEGNGIWIAQHLGTLKKETAGSFNNVGGVPGVDPDEAWFQLRMNDLRAVTAQCAHHSNILFWWLGGEFTEPNVTYTSSIIRDHVKRYRDSLAVYDNKYAARRPFTVGHHWAEALLAPAKPYIDYRDLTDFTWFTIASHFHAGDFASVGPFSWQPLAPEICEDLLTATLPKAVALNGGKPIFMAGMYGDAATLLECKEEDQEFFLLQKWSRINDIPYNGYSVYHLDEWAGNAMPHALYKWSGGGTVCTPTVAGKTLKRIASGGIFITFPTPGMILESSKDYDFRVTVHPAIASVVKTVKFFCNGLLVGTSTAPPYTIKFTAPPAKATACALLAKAYNSSGNVVCSDSTNGIKGAESFYNKLNVGSYADVVDPYNNHTLRFTLEQIAVSGGMRYVTILVKDFSTNGTWYETANAGKMKKVNSGIDSKLFIYPATIFDGTERFSELMIGPYQHPSLDILYPSPGQSTGTCMVRVAANYAGKNVPWNGIGNPPGSNELLKTINYGSYATTAESYWWAMSGGNGSRTLNVSLTDKLGATISKSVTINFDSSIPAYVFGGRHGDYYKNLSIGGYTANNTPCARISLCYRPNTSGTTCDDPTFTHDGMSPRRTLEGEINQYAYYIAYYMTNWNTNGAVPVYVVDKSQYLNDSFPSSFGYGWIKYKALFQNVAKRLGKDSQGKYRVWASDSAAVRSPLDAISCMDIPYYESFSAPSYPYLNVTATSILVNWQNVSNESGYDVQRSTDNANWSTVGSTGADVTTFTNTGLSSNTAYYYRVIAKSSCSGNRTSPSSSQTTWSTPAPSGITNGNFDGTGGWTTSQWSDCNGPSCGSTTIGTTGSGSITVIASDLARAAHGRIRQDFVLASGMRFLQYNVTTAYAFYPGGSCSPPTHPARGVRFGNATLGYLNFVEPYSEGWTLRSFDVSAYQGQSVTLEIYADIGPLGSGYCGGGSITVDNVTIGSTVTNAGIVNSNFDGSGGWTTSTWLESCGGGADASITGAASIFVCTGWAYCTGGHGRITQTFVVPVDVGSLTYDVSTSYYHPWANCSPQTNPGRGITFGNAIDGYLTWSENDNTSWVNRSQNISAYRGKSVTLEMYADIGYNVCGGGYINVDNFVITDGVAPTVSITWPAAGSAVSTSSAVAIYAAAFDDRGISRVDFYADGAYIGTDALEPFACNWATPATPKTCALTAIAYAASGLATTSAAVSVNVTDQTPPTVAIASPANGSSIAAGSTAAITATATDNVGVTLVKFYADGDSIGVVYGSPIAYWRLDGDATDASGNGNNGTLVNSPAWEASQSGYGSALRFNGSSQYVISSNLPAINNANPLTVALWFKADQAGVILDELGQTTVNAGWHDSWIEILSDGTVKVRVWGVVGATAGSVSFGAWNHVALVYANGSLTGYINGVAGTPVSGTRAYPGAYGYGEYLALGATDGTNLGNGAWFKGLIDEVRIYNRSVSTDEMQNIYVNTFPTACSWTPALNRTAPCILTAKAYDAAGNVGISNPDTVKIADQTPPVTFLTGPASNNVVAGGSIVVIADSVTDNIGIAKVEFYVDGALICTATEKPYRYGWTAPLAARSCVLTAKAYDYAGNSATTEQAIVTVPGLVGYWKLDGNASDSSGNGNNGTVSGATWTVGQVGNALSFDGVSHYANMGSSNTLKMNAAFTAAAWIYPKGSGSHTECGGIIVNKEGEYEIARFTDGTIQFAVANSSPGWTWISTGYTAPLNAWTHIAWTYSAADGLLKVYANGTQVYSGTGSGNVGDVVAGQDELWIGGRSGVSQFFNGLIDEVRIYNRALSGPEIDTLYVEGRFYTSTRLAAGAYHSIALKPDGAVWAWGRNTKGQLGDSTTTQRTAPVKAKVLTNAVAVAVGDTHSLAIKHDGTVWAWGYNGYGQLGDSTVTQRNYPVKAKKLTNVIAAAGGAYHSLALKSDGTVWAWGRNNYYQLGDSSTTQRNYPIQTKILSGVVAIAAGEYYSMALKGDGTVWTWGYNVDGQLGLGDTLNRTAPVKITTLSGITVVKAGRRHSLAIKNDGKAWAWGRNANGQLGDSTTTKRKAPVQVKVLSNVTAINCGYSHSLAVKSDGTAWAWGYNNYYQLGDSTTTQRTYPVRTKKLTAAQYVAAGVSHSLASQNDGSVFAWGRNNNGQLGLGDLTNRYAPVQISGMLVKDACDVDAGTEVIEQMVESTKPAMPSATKLNQSYPNPLNRQTTISFQLASPAQTTLKVYNVLGQAVKTLVNECLRPGYYSVKWNGKDESGHKVAAGVYLYRMSAGDYSATSKMTVLR